MAKRKTPKMDKVVDLKPKAEKINNEQLEKLQRAVGAINKAKSDLGGLELQKQSILSVVGELNDVLVKLRDEFHKDYGTDNINISDGSIMYPEEKAKENVEVNS